MTHIRTSVIDPTGNHEENIVQWGKDLGTSMIRRKLFCEIYGRISKPRSKKQLMKAAGIPGGGAQQAQNELEHLANKNLIERIANDGSVSDGSRHLYRKDPDVRHLKDRIIRLADNRKLANNIATKRNPVIRGIPVPRLVVTRRELKKKHPLNILYLMANPNEEKVLRIDFEVRKVLDAVRGSKLRDNVKIHQSPAANIDSIVNGLNDLVPRIVHFSGHGYNDGIAIDNSLVERSQAKIITFDLLAKAFKLVDSPPEVVVLNTCKSAGAKRALLPTVKAMVVMNDSITDIAATAFATKFYAAIASGQSLESAFMQGQFSVELASINEANVPVLVTAKGVNPKKLFLA